MAYFTERLHEIPKSGLMQFGAALGLAATLFTAGASMHEAHLAAVELHMSDEYSAQLIPAQTQNPTLGTPELTPALLADEDAHADIEYTVFLGIAAIGSAARGINTCPKGRATASSKNSKRIRIRIRV